MAVGPGKYDEALTLARQACGATCAVLIVFDGKRGAGFSCQATPAMTLSLPEILRLMANSIEEDLRAHPLEPRGGGA
jgi:hypothetical protein